MQRKTIMRVLVAACVCALALTTLVGCIPNPASTSQQQSDNRDYMAQVNQNMEELNTRLETFTAAAGRSDIVAMKTQADNAFKAIDDLSAMTPPDNMKDVQNEYVSGCNDLKDALNGYISLYSDIDSANIENPFDYATYSTRLDDIQQKYDSGISHLQSGDQKVTDMEP